jgi:hypothetical protein
MSPSPLYASWQFRHVKPLALSRIAILTRTRRGNVSLGHSSFRSHNLTAPRVSNLLTAHWHDLHWNMGSQVPFHPCVHNLQELDHHHDCIRRGSLVRWFRHTNRALLIRSYGCQLRDRRLGRYPTRNPELRNW